MVSRMQSVVRWCSLFTLSMLLNEFIAIYMSPRWAAVGWALVALWILYDGVAVAAELARVEGLLLAETKRCEEMRLCHSVSTDIRSRLVDNHLLLCEIRQRVVAQGQGGVSRSHSQLAGGSLPVTVGRHRDKEDKEEEKGVSRRRAVIRPPLTSPAP
jgi:hypothetical protein